MVKCKNKNSKKVIYIKNAACEKQSHRRRLFESGFFQFFFCSETFVRIGNLLLQFFYFYDCQFRIFSDFIADGGKQNFCIFNFFEIKFAVNGKYMHRSYFFAKKIHPTAVPVLVTIMRMTASQIF